VLHIFLIAYFALIVYKWRGGSKAMKPQVIIVLSGGITHSGKLPFFVKRRLDEAGQRYFAGESSRIIVTGKWSYLLDKQPARTEASAMAEYLEKLGVHREHVLVEDEAYDLVSSAFLIRRKILRPRRMKRVFIIGSDFQEERARYVWDTALDEDYTITYQFIPSHLSPELLWRFFVYEGEVLQKTKALFTTTENLSASYHTRAYLRLPFYHERIPGYLRTLVWSKRIGRQSASAAHYSLRSIYKKRRELFEKYGLDLKKYQTLKADFWSGRFLNFLGRDENGAYYCLKFALKPKDKQTFINEIDVIRWLGKQGVNFVPEIVDAELNQAPLWYLYRVVSGRNAGKFSISYSFDDNFYQPFVLNQLIGQLAKLRTLPVSPHLTLPRWDKDRYTRVINRIMEKLSDDTSVLSERLRARVLEYVINAIEAVDTAPVVLSHSDLHPANILVSTSKRSVYLIDFEHVAYNTIAFDFCFIYLFSWDRPEFQKDLKSKFLESLTGKERESFRRVFPVTYCYFLIWLLDFVVQWRTRAGDERYRQALTYIHTALRDIVRRTPAQTS